MTGMGKVTVCWAPECAGVIEQTGRGRPQRYCGVNCKMKAVRRNGGKAPTEPYPPLEPLQQDAAASMVVPGSEQQAVSPGGSTSSPSQPGRSDAEVLGQARPTRRGGKRPGNATPPAGAPAGKAPAPTRKNPPTGKPAAPPRQGKAKAPADKPMQRSDGEGVRTPPAGAKVTQLHVAVTEDSTVPVTVTVHPMVAQYRRDLEQMGQDQTRQGLQVLAMAEKLVSSATSPAAASGLSKELDRLMAALEENTPAAKAERDPSQLIRERTLAKLRLVANG